MKNDKLANAIALLLMFSMIASLAILPTVRAQGTNVKTTYCFIGANPNPVGVGQEVLLHFGITDPLQGLHSTLA
jgi:hypothetical protein